MHSPYQYNNNFDGDIRLNFAFGFDTVRNLTNKFISTLNKTEYIVPYTLTNQPSSYSETLNDTRSKIIIYNNICI